MKGPISTAVTASQQTFHSVFPV